MKYIRLEYGRELAITDTAFTQIQAIALANTVCRVCDTPFTNERPNVARNLCLEHFLLRNQHLRLRYVRVWNTTAEGETTHWFLDPEGSISYTISSSDDATKSAYFTLLHWDFPVPETYTDGEEEKPLSQWQWTIYGKVMTDPVVLIANSLDYGSTKSVEFLSYRGTQVIPINRRKGEGRRLFLKARKLLEATREEGKGAYHWHDQTFYSIESYWLMQIVAHLVSEEYLAAQQSIPHRTEE